MIERRKFVRLKDSLKITYKGIGADSVEKGSLIGDLGGGGVSIPVANRIKPGTILELEIYLPKREKPIVAVGEVVWLTVREDIQFPFLVGVKFSSMDPFDRGNILNYIAKKVQSGELFEIEWID
ncbi:MAG: PilZ domain-containing protein [Candidatus Omnitrophota bacterium]|nr:PilZ domain-containing protein [Candidatus Omnitrophota bacterium]